MSNSISGFIAKVVGKIKSFDLKKTIAAIKSFDIRKVDFRKIDREMIKKNYMWILLGVLIFALVMSKGFGMVKETFFGGKKEAEKKMVEFAETIPVKVYKVKRMDFKDTLPVMGRIVGFKEIELRFDAKGILESFNFEEGERILEGDIIATLDQKDALLKLKYANLELDKAKKMFELGGVAKLAVDQKQLEYESAKRDLERTNIYAPSDGYLGAREKDPGTYITPQDKIGVFVDFSRVYATFDVIEEDSPKIQVGQKVEIYLDAYPGESYSGTVDMVAPMIEGRTRTQKIKIELANDEGKMKPGMFARAVINTYEKKEALIIPASAFKKKENQYFVYVVHPEGEEKEGEDKVSGEDTAETADQTAPEAAPAKPTKQDAGEKGQKEPASGDEAKETESAEPTKGVIEEREIAVDYLTHDMAEVGKGLKEGELIIRELQQEYKDKDQVEITEVQESIM
jgi:membrane fusion protein (multidrug efflux system)